MEMIEIKLATAKVNKFMQKNVKGNISLDPRQGVSTLVLVGHCTQNRRLGTTTVQLMHRMGCSVRFLMILQNKFLSL